MKKLITLTLALTATALSLPAAPQTFDFKDPKGVNNVVFKLDAPLEAINGSASGVSGTITFDPDKPETARGRLIVAASSLHVGNPMMKDHMHGEKWLNVSKYPEIVFEAKELRNVKKEGDTVTADVVGAFTLKGVTKEMTVPVRFTYLKDKLGQRMPNLKGDLLVARSNFTIKRSDFDIQPGQNEDKVANNIELVLSVAGGAPR